MVEWGQWIAANRKHRGLSKKELADVLGVDEHSIGNWENRGMNPGKKAREKMTGLFGDRI